MFISEVQVGLLEGKRFTNTFLMFGYCVGKRVLQEVVPRYSSCILVKVPSLACLERNLKGEGMGGVQSEGGKERKHE